MKQIYCMKNNCVFGYNVRLLDIEIVKDGESTFYEGKHAAYIRAKVEFLLESGGYVEIDLD